MNKKQNRQTNWLKNKRRGSLTLESALVLPICMAAVLSMIRLGIMLYDTYTLSLTARDWADGQLTTKAADWSEGLSAELKRRMIYPQPIEMIKEGNGNVRISMQYMPLRTITVEIRAEADHKAKLYHFLNGRQLMERILAIEQISRQYFEAIRKLKTE